jgi:HEAT repeat protein
MGERVTYYCPHCWEEIPEGTTICPCCGKPIRANTEEDFFDKLVDALRHPVPSKAALAAQILGKLSDARGVEPLMEAYERTHDPELQEAVIRALGNLKDDRAVGRLSQVLNDASAFVTLRIAAAEALARIGSTRALAALQATAQREDRSIARAARAALEESSGVAHR